MPPPAVERSSFWETLRWGVASGVLRGIIGTPLDTWAIHAITHYDTAGKRSLAEIYRGGTAFRGFLPNCIRTSIRSPVQFLSLQAGSAAYTASVPDRIRESMPVLRGICVGFASALAESVVNTPLRVAQTIAVTGGALGPALRAEGLALLTRGFEGTLAHRLLSGAVFYGVYEFALSVGTPVSAASLAAGTLQVALSSPFYAVAVHRQRAGSDARGHVLRIAAQLARERGGTLRALFLPGLAPRLLHSWCVSPLVMWVIDVRLHAIERG